MSLIKQKLRIHNHGMGYKPIARILGISKNNISSYMGSVGKEEGIVKRR